MRRAEGRTEQARKQSPDRTARSPDRGATSGRAGNGSADCARGSPDPSTSGSPSGYTPGFSVTFFRTSRLSQLLARFNILLRSFLPDGLQTRIGI